MYTPTQISEVMDFKIKMQASNIDTKNVVYMLWGKPYVEWEKLTVFWEIAWITVWFIVWYND